MLVSLQPGRYRRFRATPHQASPFHRHLRRAQVIRAKEVKIGRLTASVVYCKGIRAKSSRVERYESDEQRREWDRPKLEVSEVAADTIHAKQIRADWIDVQESHCKEVRVGK